MKKMLKRAVLGTALIAMLSGAQAADTPLKTVHVNGYDMPYEMQGSGPPLILIHGALGDNRSWRDSLAPLAENFRVIAPISRYYGSGEWDPSWPKFHRGMLADDHAEFIRKLELGPVHLAGWSQGSAVAHLVALRNPELVRSVYLFEGAAKLAVSPEHAKAMGKKLGPLVQAVMAPLKENGPDAVAPGFFDAVAGEKGAFEKLATPDKQRIMTNARTIPLFVSKFAAEAQPVVTCQAIANSTVPTKFVIGSETAPFFKMMFADYLPCFGEARIERVDGADHIWPGKQAAAFAGSLTRFALQN